MSKVKVRLDDVKAPEPVAPGAYLFEVTKAETKVAKETDTEMIMWQLEIVEDGEYKGRKITHNTVITIDPLKDPDGEKTKFSQFMLKMFLEACAFQWDPDGFDPENVVGSRLLAQVEVSEYQGRPNNKIGRVMPVNPVAPEQVAS